MASTAHELYPIYRDAAGMPQPTQDAMRAEAAARTDALLDGIVAGTGDGR